MISSIIISITSELLLDLIHKSGNSIINRFREYFFRRDLQKWVESFIRDNTGSIIEADEFNSFIKHYNPLQRIVENITSGHNTIIRDDLINSIVEQFSSINSETTGAQDRSILKDFFNKYYDKVDSFFSNKLSESQRYILSSLAQTNKNGMKDINDKSDAVLENTKQIIELLSKEYYQEDCHELYKIISEKVLCGDINEVEPFLPIIKDRNQDLEKGISLLINMITGRQEIEQAIYDAEKINDEKIYSSLIRAAIYLALIDDNKKALSLIDIRNKDLHEIAQALVDDDYDDFFHKEMYSEDGINIVVFKIQDNYPNEKWLVHRICMYSAINDQYHIKDNDFAAVAPKDRNIIDNIVISEKHAEQFLPGTDESDIQKLFDELYSMMESVNCLRISVQARFYATILRLSHLLSNEKAAEVIEELPEPVKHTVEVERQILFFEIRGGIADESRIIDYCLRNNDYWLLYNYLIPYIDNDPEHAIQIIKDHLFIIEKDFSIFILYVCLVRKLNDKDHAIPILLKYEKAYSQYYEYWFERIELTESDTDFTNAVKLSKEGYLKYADPSGPYRWLMLLNSHSEYEYAAKVAEDIERLGQSDDKIQYQKAFALQMSGHTIEALSIYNALFDNGKRENSVIYYILYLSIINHRIVSQSVLDCAEQNENSEILATVAEYYNNNGKQEKALICLRKALLRTNDINNRAYGLYAFISAEKDAECNWEPSLVDLNTVAHLRSDANDRTIAVHGVEILPEDGHEWEGATHVYKDTAILLDLFRKRVGEEILIEGDNYILESIESLGSFFSKICFQRIVENGTAHPIKLQFDDNKLDIKVFAESVREIAGDTDPFVLMSENYRDINAIPVPFYTWCKSSRAKHFQLVYSVFDDEGMIYREYNSTSKGEANSYILSSSAAVVLYKLGWKNKSAQVFIPAVLNNIIKEDTNAVIYTNNKEHVSSMGMIEGQLYFNDSSEEQKRKEINESVRVKRFIETLDSIDNISDLHLSDNHDTEIKSIIGPADYEAITIAKEKGLTLVSGEAPLTAIASIQELSIDTMCVADFLADTTEDIFSLLEYIKILVDHKFMLAVTHKVVSRVADEYERLDIPSKEQLISKWNDILSSVEKDQEYKALIVSILPQNILLYFKDSFSSNPVIMMLYTYYYKYIGRKLVVGIKENGSVDVWWEDIKEITV